MKPEIDTSKNYILFRDDIKSPKGTFTVQMSKDLLTICGEALEKHRKLGENSSWFWKAIRNPKRFITKITRT